MRSPKSSELPGAKRPLTGSWGCAEPCDEALLTRLGTGVARHRLVATSTYHYRRSAPEDIYPELSLTRGGPLFRLARQLKLVPPASQLSTRLVVFAVGLCWLPVVLLAITQRLASHYWDPLVTGSELHFRMLVSLSFLLWGEWFFEQRVRTVSRHLLEQDLIPEHRRSAWHAVIDQLTRVRDSAAPELAVLIAVYGLSAIAYEGFLPAWVLRWLAPTIHEAGVHWANATPAWWWYLLVSQPVFFFVVLRWLSRWFLFTHLMWSLSRMPPRVHVLHADRAGGLKFLTEPLFSLRFYAAATSVALMSVWLDELARSNAKPAIFAADLTVFIGLSLILAVVPYLPFTMVLVEAKRHTVLACSALVNRYTEAFGDRWLKPNEAPASSELLGHSDFSGLADLGTSFSVADEMRCFLPGIEAVRAHAVASFLPFGLLILIYGPSAAEVVKVIVTRFIGE